MTKADFLERPPESASITDYDGAHMTLYLRLLDAASDGAAWQEAVSILFGAMDLVGGIATIPVAMLTGFAFAGPIMAFSATQRDDGNFAALFRFVITPLFLFSGTFFPISQLPAIVQPIAFLTPLWHGVNLARTVALGIGDPPLALLNLVVLVAFAVVGILLTGLTFGRRLVA